MNELTALSIKRFLQISLVITFGCWIWLYFHVDKGYWIPFTISLIYGVMDEGAVSVRMKDRIVGTLYGLLLSQVLIYFCAAHSIFAYPFYYLLLFCIFLTLRNYLIAVTFISMTVMWSNTFISPSEENVLHLSYARMINTLIAGVLCYASEFIFRTYRHTEKLIYQYAKCLHVQYVDYVGDCFGHVISNKAFSRKEQIQKMRISDVELRQILQWVPHSFSERFSRKNKQYQYAIKEFKNARSQLIVMEYLAIHYPQAVKTFVTNNKIPLFKIFVLLKRSQIEHLEEIKSVLNNLKAYNQIDAQLVDVLNALILKHRNVWLSH